MFPLAFRHRYLSIKSHLLAQRGLFYQANFQEPFRLLACIFSQTDLHIIPEVPDRIKVSQCTTYARKL